ncbi:MAG: hypothetical protein ACK5LK_07075 [Chthoniobacterales bacterium]
MRITPDNFQYALENTRVEYEPKRRIETFGTTEFRFLIVSELMDEVSKVRVRDGRIEAERPRIVAPHHFEKMLLEGFGDQAHRFAGWLEQNAEFVKILKYGFQLKKTDVSEEILSEPLESVTGRLKEELINQKSETTTLISGVDEAWEVCLLKFTTDLMQRSAAGNVDEWKRRGLI